MFVSIGALNFFSVGVDYGSCFIAVNPDYFTVKIYHGGCMINNNYVGGKFDFYDNVDKDRMSLTEVDGMVKGLNKAYVGQRIDYWFRIGSEDDALTKLTTDADVTTMCCCVPEIRLVIIYLDHLDLRDAFEDDFDDLFMYENCWFSQTSSSGVMIEELTDEPKKKPSVVIKEFPDHFSRKPKRDVGVVIKELEDDKATQASKASVLDPNDKGKQKVCDEGLVDIKIMDDQISFNSETNDEGSEDEDYLPTFEDEDYVQYGLDDDNDAWLEGMVMDFEVNEDGVGPSTNRSIVISNVHEGTLTFEDNEEMFGSTADSDEEAIGPIINSDGEREDSFPEFNPKKDMKNPKFKKGMKFSSSHVLRAAIRERAIQDGWEAVFIKSDKQRIRVICKADNCPYELFASKMHLENTLQIKTYIPEHNCSRVFDNSMVSAKYLSKQFVERIKLNTGWSTGTLFFFSYTMLLYDC